MTIIFIIATSIVSFVAFRDRELFYKFSFNPFSVTHQKQWYRTFSHILIHADWMHLLMNMFVLFSFGGIVESQLKLYFPELHFLYYILLYAGAAVFSCFPALIKHKNDYQYNSVGASGVTSAIVFTFILFNPWGGIGFIFIPIPIPAFVFGILYLIYSAYMAKRNSDNIGHDAHFAGAIFGFIFPLILKPSLITNFIDLLIT